MNEYGKIEKLYSPFNLNPPLGTLWHYPIPSVPYTTDIRISEDNSLADIEIEFIPESDMSISPKVTREILGEPLKISTRAPAYYKLIQYRGSDKYGIVYKYSIDKYSVSFFFPFNSKKMQDKLNNIELKKYDNHDDLSALTIDITLKK